MQLWNLHAGCELFEFDLPEDRPRLWVEPPGVSRREVAALLQTVLIEPELDRVTLTWMGALEVAAVYPPNMASVMQHGAVWTRAIPTSRTP